MAPAIRRSVKVAVIVVLLTGVLIGLPIWHPAIARILFPNAIPGLVWAPLLLWHFGAVILFLPLVVFVVGWPRFGYLRKGWPGALLAICMVAPLNLVAVEHYYEPDMENPIADRCDPVQTVEYGWPAGALWTAPSGAGGASAKREPDPAGPGHDPLPGCPRRGLSPIALIGDSSVALGLALLSVVLVDRRRSIRI